MLLHKPIHLARTIRLALTDNVRRWRRATREAPVWDERNRQIGALVRPGSAVLDIGAGAQTLRTHLPAGCEYQACDLFPKTPDTLVCDFNAGLYPALTRRYDYAVCSGVLEYIRNLDAFLRRMLSYAETAIVTYAVRQEGDSRLQRMGYGWVNHLRRDELEAMLKQCAGGFEVAGQWQNQIIYLLRSGRADPVAKPAVLP